MEIKIGSRVVLMLKGKDHDAIVLGVDQARANADGDPALDLAYFDESLAALAGTAQWNTAFLKLDAVKHFDHIDVEEGREIASWDYPYGTKELVVGHYLIRNFGKELRVGDTAALIISRLGEELKGWREGTRKCYSDGTTAFTPLGSAPLPDTPLTCWANRPAELPAKSGDPVPA